MAVWRRFGAVLVCALAVTAGCDRDASGPGSSPSSPAASAPSAGSQSTAPPGPAATTAGASATVATAPSAPPIVTGSSKPPGGAGVAAAPPPCAELKPLIDRHLSGVRITREAPAAASGACFLIGAFQGAGVQAEIRYGHHGSAAAVRKATGAGCAAAVRPLELPFPTALGCDHATGSVHSAAGLARRGRFAVAVVSVTGDSAGTAQQRAAVSDAARKLAADVLGQLG